MIDIHELDVAIEDDQETWPPSSISASKWSECDRRMWLGFRMASPVHFSAKTLRIFNVGHALEDSMCEWLEKTGAQVAMREARLVNSFGTTLAKIDGILAKDGKFNLLEMKTANSKRFRAWLKYGVPDNYFAQVQLEMHHSDQLSKKGNALKKCTFVVLNKDDSDVHIEEVDYDKVYATLQTERIENLIATDAVPAPEKSFKCKMCDQREVCEGEVMPEINCRTCANVSVTDGKFTCPFGDSPCNKHIMHPQLMELSGYELQSVDHENLILDYGDFAMAPEFTKHPDKPTFNTWQMKIALDEGMMDDPTYMALCQDFGAKPVTEEAPF